MSLKRILAIPFLRKKRWRMPDALTSGCMALDSTLLSQSNSNWLTIGAVQLSRSASKCRCAGTTFAMTD